MRKVMDGPMQSTRVLTARSGRIYRESTHAGFSLIEVLVTLLILAFGLSGWALLLALGLHTQYDAYARTQSTLLSSALMERIRVRDLHPGAAELGAYTRLFSESESDRCAITGTSADNDRICWFQSLQKSLPKGNGHISLSGEQLLIETFWFDSRAVADPRINKRAKCEAASGANRVWSDNPKVNWVPANTAPAPPVCLQVQRWTLPL